MVIFGVLWCRIAWMSATGHLLAAATLATVCRKRRVGFEPSTLLQTVKDVADAAAKQRSAALADPQRVHAVIDHLAAAGQVGRRSCMAFFWTNTLTQRRYPRDFK